MGNFGIMKRVKRKNGIKMNYTYGEFLVLFPCCKAEHGMELLEVLKRATKPAFIGKKEVPANLNVISYGMLDDLHNSSSSADPIASAMKILLGVDEKFAYSQNVFDVFGFNNFVVSEIQKINKLFSALKVRYSSEEISAGVKDLNFGSFGVLDWYARRMGIVNQNDVREVAWIRIYNCMKNDTEQNNYERRLRKQYLSRNK